jgi:acyl-CoA reductase-like NAD-dependent aldehyde dehydrogenase
VSVAAEIPAWSMVIDGDAVDTGEWLDVRSPYSGELVARVAWGTAASAERAVAAGESAMRRPLAVEERHAVLLRIADGVLARRDEIAGTLCREAGKPWKAALVEIDRAVSTFRRAGEEALRIAGEVVPLSDGPNGQSPKIALTLRKPVGVIGAITPFNFPLNLAAHKVAPALAAGCAVVLKPAEKAPGAARMLASIAAEAGLPAGWLNVVTGPAAELVQVLLDDPRVALISFTGSAAVGWDLAARAPTKRVALELGNVTPLIVEADADVRAAAASVVAGGFGFAGQTCLSVQRVLVHDAVADHFLDELIPRVTALRCGDPEDPQTDVGPLITAEAAERVLGWIEEARASGARVLAGGDLDGQVLQPTVVTGVRAPSPLLDSEVFGPVVAVTPYAELRDAIAQANGTELGLQAAIFTAATSSALRAARELRFGAVIVNDSPTFRQDHMPYGGVKLSGNTREGPARAIREMTEECLVVLDG